MNPTSPSRPSVSVVIPTRARRDMLQKCIESLFVQDYPADRYEIIVVEDGTRDGESLVAELLPKSPVPMKYVQITHSGAATARNVGLQQSQADIVAYIDDDGLANRDWLSQLVDPLMMDGVAGSGGRVSPEYPDSVLQAQVLPDGEVKWSGFNVTVPEFREVDFVAGGNMAFWRNVLLEVRGMDAGYTRRGSWREDTDLHMRLRFKGYRHIYNSKAQIAHRAARWMDPIERVRPGIVSAMIRDDAYFRAKNFGWAGVGGAIKAALRDSRKRIVIGAANLLLAVLHLVAWVPGAWKGLRRKNRQYGTLPPQ